MPKIKKAKEKSPVAKKQKALFIVPRSIEPAVTSVLDINGEEVVVGDYVAGMHIPTHQSLKRAIEGRVKSITREFGGVSVILEHGEWLSCVNEGDRWRAGGTLPDRGCTRIRSWGIRRVEGGL